MQPILGKDCLLSLQVDGVYYPVLCATDISVSTREEIVLATSATSGGWRRKRIRGLGEWGIQLTGLSKVDNSDGQVSIFYLMQNQKSAFLIMVLYEDDAGNTASVSGTVVIPEISLSAPVGDFISGVLTMEGDGEMFLDVNIDNPVPGDGVCEVQETLEKMLAENTSSLTVTEITVANAEVLWVTREGNGLREITTGTPVGRQYRINYSTGVITLDPNLPGAPGGEQIEIGWQITI